MTIQMKNLSRRDFIALASGLLISAKAVAQTGTPLLARAMRGPLPDAAQRRRMVEFIEAL
ncbi:MAG: hypothetical protein FWD77_01845 [Betaproteobacteria bacterium]|nr:hypothetical protein [Betaproteobacteria bacterium]